MKCENCGKNEVTFVYRSSINGKTEEKHLCSECAEKLGYTRRLTVAHQNMMRNFFGGDSFFGAGLPGIGGASDGFFGDGDFFGGSLFGNRGFFGLPALMGRMLDNPFDDFFTDMPALGAAPSADGGESGEKKPENLVDKEEESRFDRWRKLNALKLEMKKAVHKEDFERAAQLRDEIRAMEEKKSA